MALTGAVYDRFAKYYDFVYEDLVDYDADVRYLEDVFRTFLPREPRTLLDLGCGTGNHALRLARRGLDVTGLDASPQQLAIARRKARAARVPARFVEADMRSFRLPERFDVVVCMFGAFGYLLRTRDVERAIRSVRTHLAPGGLFAFEFWQSSGAHPPPFQSWVHKVGRGLELVRLSVSRYDPQNRLLPIEFRFFVTRGRQVVDRFDETHTVRTYRIPELRGLLRRGGLEVAGAFEIGVRQKKGFRPPRRETFRVFAVCRPRRSRADAGLRRASGSGRGPRDRL